MSTLNRAIVAFNVQNDIKIDIEEQFSENIQIFKKENYYFSNRKCMVFFCFIFMKCLSKIIFQLMSFSVKRNCIKNVFFKS